MTNDLLDRDPSERSCRTAEELMLHEFASLTSDALAQAPHHGRPCAPTDMLA